MTVGRNGKAAAGPRRIRPGGTSPQDEKGLCPLGPVRKASPGADPGGWNGITRPASRVPNAPITIVRVVVVPGIVVAALGEDNVRIC